MLYFILLILQFFTFSPLLEHILFSINFNVAKSDCFNIIPVKIKTVKYVIKSNKMCILKFQTITDAVGNSEEECRAEFYNQPWIQEAVNRYLYSKFHQKQTNLKHHLDIFNS